MKAYIEGWGIPESKRKPRVQNPFCEMAFCKHCKERIGHRPYTRDWEHEVPNQGCEKPYPMSGMCLCKECKSKDRDCLL